MVYTGVYVHVYRPCGAMYIFLYAKIMLSYLRYTDIQKMLSYRRRGESPTSYKTTYLINACFCNHSG